VVRAGQTSSTGVGVNCSGSGIGVMGLKIEHGESEGTLPKVCPVCHQAIREEERWFRVHEEYAHLICSERYLRLISERRQQAKTAPLHHAPDIGRERPF
jgi:hypothetical protein